MRVHLASLLAAGALSLSSQQPLFVQREDLRLWIYPGDNPVAEWSNQLWTEFEIQKSPSPPIMEGLFTLYGYSETAYGVVSLRAADYEQGRSYGYSPTPWGELLLRLRGDGVDGFRERVYAEGFDGVMALKSDDVGRWGLVQLYDDRAHEWLPPLKLLVLDSASGDSWERLKFMAHPFEGRVMMPWIADISKDAVEAAGLSRLVENTWSGFARIVLNEATDYSITWPVY